MSRDVTDKLSLSPTVHRSYEARHRDDRQTCDDYGWHAGQMSHECEGRSDHERECSRSEMMRETVAQPQQREYRGAGNCKDCDDQEEACHPKFPSAGCGRNGARRASPCAGPKAGQRKAEAAKPRAAGRWGNRFCVPRSGENEWRAKLGGPSRLALIGGSGVNGRGEWFRPDAGDGEQAKPKPRQRQ